MHQENCLIFLKHIYFLLTIVSCMLTFLTFLYLVSTCCIDTVSVGATTKGKEHAIYFLHNFFGLA